MKPLKQARRLIAAEPSSAAARTLAALVLALEQDGQFDLSSLYLLDLEHFELALEVLRDWRLDRFMVGKARLLDMAMHLRELDAEQAAGGDPAAAAGPASPDAAPAA